MIVSLAARNVLRRRRQSLLGAGLIAAAVALLFFGNSILEGTEAGLHRSFAESFTGELAVAATGDRPFGLFGDETPAIGEYTPLPVIRDFEAVMAVVSADPGIQTATPLITVAAVVDLGGIRRSLPVFGIDFATYFQAFPRLSLVAGGFPEIGRAAALISSARADEIASRAGRRPLPEDAVVLSTFGHRGFRIEELPVAGIIEFAIPNPLLESTVLVDAQTVRALLGVTLANAAGSPPPEEAAGLLGEDLDSLFQDAGPLAHASPEVLTLQDVRRRLLEPAAGPAAPELWSGAWHFILLRLKPGTSPRRVLNRLSQEFRLRGLDVTVLDWRRAAGMSARLVVLLRLLYNAGFLVLALAAVIVVVNLLLIAVIARSAEIATLRALGATRGFIRGLLLSETALVSFFGGLAGVLLGGALVLLLGLSRLQLNSGILQTLFGGGRLILSFSPRTAVLSLLAAVAIGMLSCLYPVSLALRIQPARSLLSE